MYAPFDPVDADKPLADVIEQREPALPSTTGQTPVPTHADEGTANAADVLEQDQEVPLEDDDYRDAEVR